jgi:hypothetical protein
MAPSSYRSPVLDLDVRGPQLWCPEDILNLCEDGRCVGFAPSRRRKCQAIIRCTNANMVGKIIDEISRQRPDPILLRPWLLRLAAHGLCVRFHQDQADAMVERWTNKINAAFPAGTSSARAPSPTSVAASSISLTAPSQPDNLRETIRETMRCTNELLERLNNHSPGQTPSISRISTSDISSLALSRHSTIPSDSSEHTTTSSSSDVTRPTRTAILPRPRPQIFRTVTVPSTDENSTRSTASVTPTPQTQHCTRRHARRLALDDTCPICFEGDNLSDCDAVDLVWCKSSCGRSAHKSCFETWRAQRVLDGQDPTCVVCRAAWDDECDCDGCCHVPRRPVEAKCAICLDALLDEGATPETEESLVWCKDGCGNSVHTLCFDVWQTHCLDSGRRATCVLCRATWNGDCSC